MCRHLINFVTLANEGLFRVTYRREGECLPIEINTSKMNFIFSSQIPMGKCSSTNRSVTLQEAQCYVKERILLDSLGGGVTRSGKIRVCEAGPATPFHSRQP